MMELTEDNIQSACRMYEGEFASSVSSFLTDIHTLVKSVKFVNNDACDYWFSSPHFEFHHCNDSVVVNLNLKYCSKTFKRYFRYKCGHAHEQIYYLDHVNVYYENVYFYSKQFLLKIN